MAGDFVPSEMRLAVHFLENSTRLPQSVLRQISDSVEFHNIAPIAAGRYMVRGFLPDELGYVWKQEIQINAGTTTEAYLDFGELHGDMDSLPQPNDE